MAAFSYRPKWALMRDISYAAISANSWTAWSYDPKERRSANQRSELWTGKACSY